MTQRVSPRLLTGNEATILRRFIVEVRPPLGEALLAQVEHATVLGGIPTVLDLDVGKAQAAPGLEDGPLPGRMVGIDGEILVWVSSGRISGLEYAWWCDNAPSEMPPADALRLSA